MTVVLWSTAAVLLLLAHLVVHEAAHALALRRMGGRIEEAGLGLPLRPRKVWPATGRRPFRLSLSPWVIAAYVQPDPEAEVLIRNARYRDQVWFAGAGVVANLISGMLCLAVVAVVDGQWTAAVLVAAAALAVWFLRVVLCMLLPVLGIAAAFVVGVALVRGFEDRAGGGPIALAQALVVDDGRTALLLGAGLGLALALFNMVPLYPFDGGRVMDAALRASLGARWADPYRTVSSWAALGVLVYALLSDAVFALI